jgi:hypothetical protein
LLRYSDVAHEVTPITDGYRFVLTYNLAADPQGARPSASMSYTTHGELHRLLRHWQSDLSSGIGSSDGSVIHQLEYQYTEQRLRLQSLKGRDLDVARTLQDACNATGFLCFLASCERRVYGSCDYDYEDYGHGYRSRYNHYGSYNDDSYHEISDVFDTSLHLKKIFNMNGILLAENVEIDEEDFLVENPFEDKTPDNEDYSGYTGNEGVSATHWYRDTVSSADSPVQTVAKHSGHCDCIEY